MQDGTLDLVFYVNDFRYRVTFNELLKLHGNSLLRKFDCHVYNLLRVRLTDSNSEKHRKYILSTNGYPGNFLVRLQVFGIRRITMLLIFAGFLKS